MRRVVIEFCEAFIQSMPSPCNLEKKKTFFSSNSSPGSKWTRMAPPPRNRNWSQYKHKSCPKMAAFECPTPIFASGHFISNRSNPLTGVSWLSGIFCLQKKSLTLLLVYRILHVPDQYRANHKPSCLFRYPQWVYQWIDGLRRREWGELNLFPIHVYNRNHRFMFHHHM